MSKCRCDYCVDGRGRREEYRHGGINDFEDEVPYRKQSRKGRKSKACKKSKTGEQCDFSVKKVYRSYNHYKNGQNMTDYVMTCSRCGKHGPVLWAQIWDWEF